MNLARGERAVRRAFRRAFRRATAALNYKHTRKREMAISMQEKGTYAHVVD